jgi:hypothetical protein
VDIVDIVAADCEAVSEYEQTNFEKRSLTLTNLTGFGKSRRVRARSASQLVHEAKVERDVTMQVQNYAGRKWRGRERE